MICIVFIQLCFVVTHIFIAHRQGYKPDVLKGAFLVGLFFIIGDILITLMEYGISELA